jgi:hypothetical protein
VGRRLRIAGLLLALVWAVSALATPRPVNPPVQAAMTLDAHVDVPADVQALLRRACADCHSNDTRWPWYATVFPASWLIARDVRDARGQLNLSRWGTYGVFEQADLLDEVCIRAGARVMPPDRYRWLHPDARLSDADLNRLCVWTHLTVGRLLEGYE